MSGSAIQAAQALCPLPTRHLWPPAQLPSHRLYALHLRTSNGICSVLTGHSAFRGNNLDFEAGERRLTADEERCLALLVSNARPPPSDNGYKHCVHGEIEALAIRHSVSILQAQRIVQHAHWARRLLIRYHWRYLHFVAHKFKNKTVEHIDLFMEGLHGLEKAADLYEPGYGKRFAAHAYMHIRRYILEAIAQASSLTEPSQYDLRLLKRVQNARHRIASGAKGHGIWFKDPQRVPIESVAKEAGISTALAKRVVRSARHEVSLDALSGNADDEYGEEAEVLGDQLACYEADAEFEADGRPRSDVGAADSAKIRGSFATVLQTLDPRERNIVRLRFGLNKEGQEVPRARIADAYGISVQEVARLERLALKKLKAPWRRAYMQRTCGDLMTQAPWRVDVVPAARHLHDAL